MIRRCRSNSKLFQRPRKTVRDSSSDFTISQGSFAIINATWQGRTYNPGCPSTGLCRPGGQADSAGFSPPPASEPKPLFTPHSHSLLPAFRDNVLPSISSLPSWRTLLPGTWSQSKEGVTERCPMSPWEELADMRFSKSSAAGAWVRCCSRRTRTSVAG